MEIFRPTHVDGNADRCQNIPNFQANTLMISDAAQNSRFERDEANQRELLGKLEGLEAADVYLQVDCNNQIKHPKGCSRERFPKIFYKPLIFLTLAAFAAMESCDNKKRFLEKMRKCTSPSYCICYLHLIGCMHACISAKVAEILKQLRLYIYQTLHQLAKLCPTNMQMI